MRIDTKQCRFVGLLVLALATMNAAQRQHSIPNAAAEDKIRQLARVQVVDQVEPLYRALFPERDMLRFLAVRASVYHKDNRRSNLWLVDCLDTDSHIIAQTLWDVDTKRALQFGPTMAYTALKKKQASLSPMDEKKAVFLAREWAARLRPVSGEEVLYSEYQAQHISNVWKVRLHLSDGIVVVWINARSGDLQNAVVQDAPAYRHPS